MFTFIMKHPQKRKVVRWIWISVIISLISITADLSGLLDIPERKTIDFRTKLLRIEKSLPLDIAIILIDEASLDVINLIAGRWPWPRDVHASVIEFLGLCGARAVIMDILFTENELENMTPGETLSPSDLMLAESTGQAANVYHAAQVITDLPEEYNTNLLNTPMPDSFVNKFSLDVSHIEGDTDSYYNMFYLPFRELYEKAKSVGIVNFSPDKDGVFRSEKMLLNYQGHYFPALSLAPFIEQLKPKEILLSKESIKIKGLKKDTTIPLTENGEYYVNMYGNYTHNVFSYSGVFQTIAENKMGEMGGSPVSPQDFKDKTIFIGASAVAVEDMKHTSIAIETPGVLLHASMYANLITGDFLTFSNHYLTAGTILILTMVTVFSIFFMTTIFSQALLPIVLTIGYCAIAIKLFNSNIVIAMAAPLLAFSMAYIASFAHISATEGREKRKIKNILGQYVSPAMLSQVLEKHKEDYLKAEVGTKEILTIFFSDIRGFTSISEKYEVEKVVEVLNAYLSRMVNIIFHNQGTLDKFIGDAIVAFWGAPVKIHDHSYKAVLSAIEMGEALDHLNKENMEKGLPELHIGIGIHTGEVILGNIGSEKKLDYTVIGDSVNLASRLEGLTKTYNCQIIITQDTFGHIQDKIVCRMVDYVKVKGKDKPILIFEVLGETGRVDERTLEICDLTEKAFNYYRKKMFVESISTFNVILEIKPNDFLTRMFIKRCENYQENPPQDGWDGYYVHKTK